jgi:hypothetical protein
MNSFSATQPNEEILKEERIHPGIFALPVLVLIAFGIITLPVIPFLTMTRNLASQFGSQQSQPAFNLIWLIVLLPDLLITGAVFVAVLVAYLKCHVTLTDKRLIYTTGFLARYSGELPLENIDALFMSEPLLGRLLGYGTVTVCTLGGTRFKLDFLSKPHLFHAALQRALAQAKSPVRSAPKLAPVPQDDSRYMPKPS